MRSIGRILSVVIAVCGAAFGFICGYIIMQFEGERASSAVKLSPLGLALLFALPGLLAFRDCNKRSKKQLSKFTTPVDENATD